MQPFVSGTTGFAQGTTVAKIQPTLLPTDFRRWELTFKATKNADLNFYKALSGYTARIEALEGKWEGGAPQEYNREAFEAARAEECIAGDGLFPFNSTSEGRLTAALAAAELAVTDYAREGWQQERTCLTCRKLVHTRPEDGAVVLKVDGTVHNHCDIKLTPLYAGLVERAREASVINIVRSPSSRFGPRDTILGAREANLLH
jgi:hypothetical protein